MGYQNVVARFIPAVRSTLVSGLVLAAGVASAQAATVPDIDPATAAGALAALGGAAIVAAGLAHWALGAASSVIMWAKRVFSKG